MRKYDKGEYVNINQNGLFIGYGKVEKWKYSRKNKTYDYFIEDVTGEVHGWWEEGHLENLKIHLPREDKEKIDIFCEALNTLGIGVSFQNTEKKKTYVLIGKDLLIAKAIFTAILREKWTHEVVINDTLYQFHPNGTFRNTKNIKGKFLCPDCGHYHGNER